MPPELEPLLDVGLIHAPGVVHSPHILVPVLFKVRHVATHPAQDGRMSQGDAALGHHWTRSRELSLNVRYRRTHRTMIFWSKCRPLKSSCVEVSSVIQAVTAGSRAFQVCTRPYSVGTVLLKCVRCQRINIRAKAILCCVGKM
jgi:hypothetical protein